ncbi:hypothetical protein BJX99DRAFT_126620 [Aspergillus californicus]
MSTGSTVVCLNHLAASSTSESIREALKFWDLHIGCTVKRTGKVATLTFRTASDAEMACELLWSDHRWEHCHS